jgi:activator of HSP90 ATPase
MKKSFRLKESFNVSPETLYTAWLDSKTHSEMTGGSAQCSAELNGAFSTWDGYITGFNKALIPNKEIVQSWRTTEFLDSDNDSEVIIQLSKTSDGCRLTLIHQNIPEGQPDYEKGWIDYYFEPMKDYFN